MTEVTGSTGMVAIFGDPVRHTLSPAMHNAAFDELGMDNLYAAFHVRPEGLKAAVEGLRAMGMVGANITVPHKEAVLGLLDEVDDEAGTMGAVNTVVNRDGRLTGFNTDGRGFVMALEKDAGFDPAGGKVFVCGSGGAARGVGFALAMAGAETVYFYDIDLPKRDRLVSGINDALGRSAAAASGADPGFIRGMDLVVNATPLGMRAGDPAPLPEGSFRPGQTVCDVIYNPARTVTTAAAEAAGARAVNGLGMLLYQGVIAFERWFGRTPPADTMRAAVLKKL